MLFTIITLSILTFSIVSAYIFSHIMLNTDLLKAQKIQTSRYKKNVFKEHLPLIVLNLGILYVVSGLGLYFANGVFKIEMPSLGIFILQFAIMAIVDDTFFYFFHRFLHDNEYLFKKIHKIHHKASPPFALDFIYVHPLEWLGGAVGTALGILLVYLLFGEINAYAFWFFAAVRNLHEVDIHSGIKSFFSKYIPFLGSAEHHEAHHARIKGNYSSMFTFWDKIFGTDLK